MFRENIGVDRNVNDQDNVHEADAILQPVVGEPLHHFTDPNCQAAITKSTPNEEYCALLYCQFVAVLLWHCQQEREED